MAELEGSPSGRRSKKKAKAKAKKGDEKARAQQAGARREGRAAGVTGGPPPSCLQDEGKKPKSAIAEKLRAAQEARAREEAAMTLAQELAEEAQRLDKALAVVRFSDMLEDVGVVSVSEIDELVAKSAAAAADYSEYDRILKIGDAALSLRSGAAA
ncbi:hypothetical protein EMIHUDRAFT_211251 [Emiliania huxleyi CCMP1516]|uniref:Uncharacterized protein n=2 Tax=Emiliania huxleyi TaxID=2903 RepID=A0A0D3IWP5_EMIH1|nr:hypothetical protein EMIHUDRAFT_211251 [Emiliania huxleyi CCMP1516]EOD15680.1 hypothetical protein EMIHUDRAFT_211251 [Emiliania huxleyi CCMP1516]|eukprot:XP_005768109.1 hypothetical protein EMIHUDRAFT_211251 [Emiliania huxleyi CCMP1516]